MASQSFSPSGATAAAAAADHLSRGYERLTQLRAFLLSSCPAELSTMSPTIRLLDKALSCLVSALAELQTTFPYSASSVEDGKSGTNPPKRRRKKAQSWTIVTSVPHFDGHQWRKYGQKRIDRAEFPRSYFKCTYSSEQGCPASKTVQKKEDDDANPPVYEVCYSMQHTCRAMETAGSPFVMDSSAAANRGETSSLNWSLEPSTSGGRTASSDQPFPATSPLQVAGLNDDLSFWEQVDVMEPLADSAELCGEENVWSDLLSPLYELDFDWELLMN